MTSNFKEITEKINEYKQSKPFMRLGDLNTENKKWISELWFDTGNAAENRLRLQLPKCYTKSGIVETASKTYTDLMFDNSEEDVKDMVNLFLALETETARQLHERSSEWFSGETEKMTKEEFEDMITSLVRLVNRQTNVCIRVNIPMSSNQTKSSPKRSIKQTQNQPDDNSNINNSNNNYKTNYDCQIYNRRSETRELNDIKADTQILPLVEISELRMTSTNINLHVNLIECMILKETNPLPPPPVVRRINLIEKDEKEIEPNVCVEPKTHQSETENHNENITTNNDDNNSDMIKTNEKSNIEIQLQTSPETNKTETNTEPEIETGEDEMYMDGLMEIKDFDINENEDEQETITLKKPDQVYKDIYKAAITKAKKLRQVALEAYLDAKKIKAKFMLEDIYDSDDDDDDYENDDDDDDNDN